MAHEGYCTNCEEFTHDCCEPDASEYECPACGQNTVYGKEEAALMGFLSNELIEEMFSDELEFFNSFFD